MARWHTDLKLSTQKKIKNHYIPPVGTNPDSFNIVNKGEFRVCVYRK